MPLLDIPLFINIRNSIMALLTWLNLIFIIIRLPKIQCNGIDPKHFGEEKVSIIKNTKVSHRRSEDALKKDIMIIKIIVLSTALSPATFIKSIMNFLAIFLYIHSGHNFSQNSPSNDARSLCFAVGSWIIRTFPLNFKTSDKREPGK